MDAAEEFDETSKIVSLLTSKNFIKGEFPTLPVSVDSYFDYCFLVGGEIESGTHGNRIKVYDLLKLEKHVDKSNVSLETGVLCTYTCHSKMFKENHPVVLTGDIKNLKRAIEMMNFYPLGIKKIDKSFSHIIGAGLVIPDASSEEGGLEAQIIYRPDIDIGKAQAILTGHKELIKGNDFIYNTKAEPI